MSTKTITFDQIWREVESVDKDEDLSHWSIGGVYLWPILRDRLIREVAENLGVFEKRVEVARQPIPELAEIKIRRSPYAVVPFLRRNALGQDAFSQPAIDGLRVAGFDPLVFGMGDEDLGADLHVEQLESYFLKRYRRVAKARLAWSLTPRLGGAKHFAKYARVISNLETALDSRGATGQYRSLPRWLVVDFFAQRIGWTRLFKAAGTRKIFIVNAWKRALIAGAQAAGAWVVEIQHGLLSDKHPLLSWPGRNSVAYLPDEIYLWGDFWAQETGLPAGMVKTVIGEPEQVAAAEKASANLGASAEPGAPAHRSGQVLVISQAQQTTRIFDIAIRAALASPNLKFAIKPHPQETLDQFSDHLKASGQQMPANLEILQTSNSALDLISQYEYCVGVHSMALVEALKLGAKVIVVKLEGWQYIEAIARRGDLILADINSDLVAELAASRVSGEPNYYFATPLEASAFETLLLQEKP